MERSSCFRTVLVCTTGTHTTITSSSRNAIVTCCIKHCHALQTKFKRSGGGQVIIDSGSQCLLDTLAVLLSILPWSFISIVGNADDCWCFIGATSTLSINCAAPVRTRLPEMRSYTRSEMNSRHFLCKKVCPEMDH